MNAKQLLKPKTGLAEVDRHLGQMTDVLNPVLRDIASSGIKATKVMDNTPGPNPAQNGGDLSGTSKTYNAQGGTLLLLFTGDTWTPSSTGQRTLSLKLDGNAVLNATQFFNETVSTKMLTGFATMSGVSAGPHRFMVSLDANLSADNNSLFNLLVLELPT